MVSEQQGQVVIFRFLTLNINKKIKQFLNLAIAEVLNQQLQK